MASVSTLTQKAIKAYLADAPDGSEYSFALSTDHTFRGWRAPSGITAIVTHNHVQMALFLSDNILLQGESRITMAIMMEMPKLIRALEMKESDLRAIHEDRHETLGRGMIVEGSK